MLEDQRHQQPGKRFEEFFDEIKDIFKKGIEQKGLKDKPTITSVEFTGFSIDLPRKQKDMYHGSSFEILCNKPTTWCKIKGDLVVEEDYDYDTIKTLEDSNCKIFSTHTHAQKKEGKLPYRESHLHFICEDRDKIDTINLINFLKDY